MAKRRAAEQITKDGRHGDSSSGDEQENGPDDIKARIAARKIAVPKTRLRKPMEAGAASTLSRPFGALAQNSFTAESSASPFSFLGKAGASTASSTTTQAKSHSDKELKTRALNSNFAAQIAKANVNSPFESWVSMCEKYIEYSRKIAQESTSKESKSSSPDASSSKNEQSNVKSKITPSGFQFGGSSNAANATTFQFGDKKVDIAKPPAQSKPTGGFVFNPQGEGKIVKKSEGDESNMSIENNDANERDVNVSASNKPKEEPVPKPAFTFGASDTSSGAKPAFTFGASDTSSGAKPAFTFGASDASSGAKPAFSFDTPASANTGTPFSFGGSAGSSLPPPTKAEPSTGLFGSTSSRGLPASVPSVDNNSKPRFSFDWKPSTGTSGQTSGSAVAASSTSSNDTTTKDIPASSNPPTSSSTDTSSKPFVFGSSTNEKPQFSFKGSDTSKNGEQPRFSFGTSNPSKPTPFTFGSSASTNSADKPTFSFGNASDAPKPAFSFGTGTNPFAKSTQSSDLKQDASWKPSNPVKIVDDKAADAGKEDSNEPSEEQNDPQTDFGGPGPGEEDEDNVYEKKCKVFEQADGEYKTLGLGMLRVLVHKETKKARALVRAEGSGRVLLNVPIRKEFEYTTIGKGQVRLLNVKPGDQAPTIYAIRVKTEDDGNELKTKLEEVKN